MHENCQRVVISISAPQLVHGGNVDFLVFDYLSEITMSLLAMARRKSPVCIRASYYVHYVSCIKYDS